jgi:transposase
VPALQPYLIEPIWQQFSALLPERRTDHPLGCHRSRIPERVVFEKLVEVLVFGCAYERIADTSCSESTLRRRREEWIELGLMERLRQICLEAYDRLIGLELSEVAVDCCVTKAPCGGEKAGRSPVDSNCLLCQVGSSRFANSFAPSSTSSGAFGLLLGGR